MKYYMKGLTCFSAGDPGSVENTRNESQKPMNNYPPNHDTMPTGQPASYPGMPNQQPWGQPPLMPQPAQKPTRSRKRFLGYIITAFVCFILGVTVGHGTSAASSTTDSTSTTSNISTVSTSTSKSTPIAVATKAPAPTPTPTQAPQWKTVQTITGNGIKKTAIFTVPGDWKIAWSCDPTSSFNGQYNVIVTVYNSDGSLADEAVNTICQSGNTSDVTEEHQGGDIYLEIDSEGSWTLQIQELK